MGRLKLHRLTLGCTKRTENFNSTNGYKGCGFVAVEWSLVLVMSVSSVEMTSPSPVALSMAYSFAGAPANEYAIERATGEGEVISTDETLITKTKLHSTATNPQPLYPFVELKFSVRFVQPKVRRCSLSRPKSPCFLKCYFGQSNTSGSTDFWGDSNCIV